MTLGKLEMLSASVQKERERELKRERQKEERAERGGGKREKKF